MLPRLLKTGITYGVEQKPSATSALSVSALGAPPRLVRKDTIPFISDD